MRRLLSAVLAVGIILSAAPVRGQAWAPWVGDDTIAAYRPQWGRDPSFLTGIATGSMAIARIWMVCERRITVGELHAFLLYSAEPTDTLVAALATFFVQRGACYMRQPKGGA